MATIPWHELAGTITGRFSIDNADLLMYSTDASAYREKPQAVVWPASDADIAETIAFAIKHQIPLIPRAAGTSLAGQVVGSGMVVDISRFMNAVLELNVAEHWVRVQPGVVLDELNLHLQPHGLFFGPETSTSNRCMIGGMVGNNACGAHSLIYGSTRDHTLSIKGFLSDGRPVEFKTLSNEELERKKSQQDLEGKIYRELCDMLNDPQNRESIRKEYPEPRIHRRNNGYALDLLLDMSPFSPHGPAFNLSALLAGSEGTLIFASEIKLNLIPLPPKERGLICAHFNTLEEAIQGNLIALRFQPGAVELIDRVIMQCTKENITQRKNRFFIQGDPGAILVIEFARATAEEIQNLRDQIEKEMRQAGLGYHFPLVTGADINKVWALRKAGLGLLANIPGDGKPVSLVEDTTVHPENLSAYIADFKKMLAQYNLDCVYHAHIATGELHLRPVLNLKDAKDLVLFRKVAEETADLVKKYRGSLSGEHGDGRLRGEFIPRMIGQHNYELLRRVKRTFDPHLLFNPGKITDTPPMDTQLRYEPGRTVREFETVFDFSAVGGYLRLAEKCNGSADCRKSALMGGTMCPSYMATRDENASTRARANILREFITFSQKKNPFDHQEIYNVLDLCLSCKACKSECPSNVDMAKLKAEFLQHYYDSHGIPLRTRLIAYITWINRLGSLAPAVFNWTITNPFIANTTKHLIGFARERSIPTLHKFTLRTWAKKNLQTIQASLPGDAPSVYLFVDEFTDYNDTEIGIKTVQLLSRLGYRVLLVDHGQSGRTFLSKGLLRTAARIAARNVQALHGLVNEQAPLVGIEPSAILGFRDEYPDLLRGEAQQQAGELARHVYLIDEFLSREMDAGRIVKSRFTTSAKSIMLHGHCQQKAIASTAPTKNVLSFPENYTVTEIPSGCCGMAGSFGYEKEHIALSKQVGELVLFPAIRNTKEDVLIAASGTSCRHQIKDGTGRKGLHPVEILFEALL
jgi:FAD/FMN-containing dehydrogenase/Fe-S oxidoreductase